MKENRYRNICCITYHSMDTVVAVLEALPCVRHFALIRHDRDVNANTGELKQEHIHFIVNLNNSKSPSAFRSLMPSGQNTLAQPLRDKDGARDYLIHRNNPEKAQYSEDDIISDNWEYWCTEEEDDKYLSLLDDIIRRVPLRELVRRYGRDVIINWHRYYEFAMLLDRSDFN